MTKKCILTFSKINFEAINLFQKANLNKNLLWKVDLNEKNRKLSMKNIAKKLKPYVKKDKKVMKSDDSGLMNTNFINIVALFWSMILIFIK